MTDVHGRIILAPGAAPQITFVFRIRGRSPASPGAEGASEELAGKSTRQAPEAKGISGMLLAPSGLGELAEKCLLWAWDHCWSARLAVEEGGVRNFNPIQK